MQNTPQSKMNYNILKLNSMLQCLPDAIQAGRDEFKSWLDCVFNRLVECHSHPDVLQLSVRMDSYSGIWESPLGISLYWNAQVSESLDLVIVTFFTGKSRIDELDCGFSFTWMAGCVYVHVNNELEMIWYPDERAPEFPQKSTNRPTEELPALDLSQFSTGGLASLD